MSRAEPMTPGTVYDAAMLRDSIGSLLLLSI
jgi:hypothetical protein